MSISKVALIGLLAAMLIAPDGARASGVGNSFDNFGHSVTNGAKQAGHAVKNGAENVGHSIVLGWHSFKHNLDGR
jgi:hypothetical protein